jgi:hypothetical protein
LSGNISDPQQAHFILYANGCRVVFTYRGKTILNIIYQKYVVMLILFTIILILSREIPNSTQAVRGRKIIMKRILKNLDQVSFEALEDYRNGKIGEINF